MPSEEELLTRQMPHSTEAEQSVLGSMLIDARCVPEGIEALRPEDFYLRTNREIYETIYSMFNFSLTIDPVTVLEHMKQNGVYDENTSRNYVLQLMEITPTAANVKEYVAIVKDKALLRRIAETAGELTAMVQEGTGTAQYSPYSNETVDSTMDAALACTDLEESYQLWQQAQWDGETGVTQEGDIPWVWLVNIDHLYWVRDGLQVAEQKIHPHGHGWSLVNNVDQWSWAEAKG